MEIHIENEQYVIEQQVLVQNGQYTGYGYFEYNDMRSILEQYNIPYIEQITDEKPFRPGVEEFSYIMYIEKDDYVTYLIIKD